MVIHLGCLLQGGKSFLLFTCLIFIIDINIKSTSALQITPIRLTTKAKNPLQSTEELHDFLSRPVHWPEIVASSEGVSGTDVTEVLRPGSSVDEIFGLGLLTVTWICSATSSSKGQLVVNSPEGVQGIAQDCTMEFNIGKDTVELTMGYDAVSPLAILATPILVVDNWIALNVLLPAALDPQPLNSFRTLMGNLYGIAGVAHAFDLWIGGSTLFRSVGIPPFEELPIEGQIYAAVWCVVGPLSFALSRLGLPSSFSSSSSESSSLFTPADFGLVLYALVEVYGAYLVGADHLDVLGNALFVQAIVLAAWIYSKSKKEINTVNK